jgi:hypothetical protein
MSDRKKARQEECWQENELKGASLFSCPQSSCLNFFRVYFPVIHLPVSLQVGA